MNLQTAILPHRCVASATPHGWKYSPSSQTQGRACTTLRAVALPVLFAGVAGPRRCTPPPAPGVTCQGAARRGVAARCARRMTPGVKSLSPRGAAQSHAERSPYGTRSPQSGCEQTDTSMHQCTTVRLQYPRVFRSDFRSTFRCPQSMSWVDQYAPSTTSPLTIGDQPGQPPSVPRRTSRTLPILFESGDGGQYGVIS